MKDRHNITVRLGSLPPIAMHGITPEEEEVIRRAQDTINSLWSDWTKRLTDKSPQEVLAMIALRIAQIYYAREREISAIDRELEDFDAQLDRLLSEIPDVETPERD